MGKRQEYSDGSKSDGARGGFCGCFTLAYYKPVRLSACLLDSPCACKI